MSAQPKLPTPFPEARCPHGDTAPWRVIGRHLGMLKILHDRFEVGGPAQRKLAAEIRAHIGECDREVAEVEAAEVARTARAA